MIFSRQPHGEGHTCHVTNHVLKDVYDHVTDADNRFTDWMHVMCGQLTRIGSQRNARSEHTTGGLSPTTIIPCRTVHRPSMLTAPPLLLSEHPNFRSYTFWFHVPHTLLAFPKESDPAQLTTLTTHLLPYAHIICQAQLLHYLSLNANAPRETLTKRSSVPRKRSQRDRNSPPRRLKPRLPQGLLLRWHQTQRQIFRMVFSTATSAIRNAILQVS